MSILLEVILLDGTKEIVTLEEAQALRDAGELAPPVEDNKALTIEKFYGEHYGT